MSLPVCYGRWLPVARKGKSPEIPLAPFFVASFSLTVPITPPISLCCCHPGLDSPLLRAHAQWTASSKNTRHRGLRGRRSWNLALVDVKVIFSLHPLLRWVSSPWASDSLFSSHFLASIYFCLFLLSVPTWGIQLPLP